jgi:Fic family protein
MDVERFKDSPVGYLEPISGRDALGREYSHFAYIPRPLPGQIELSNRTWKIVTDAGTAVGRLDGEGRRLPNPLHLARPAIRAEAVSTSALEGTYTTLPRVMQSELIEEEASSEDREVLDYVRAAEFGFAAVSDGKPVSLNLIKACHARLMARDPHCPPNEKGELRQRQNFIGPANARIEESWFVPPPHGDGLKEGLYDWETWIHRQDELHVLVRMAVGHYQFETLHPFIVGNGRIGRLIAVLMLLGEGMLSVPILNISPYLEKRRTEYQDRLREVSASGNFDRWVAFFSDGVREQAAAALDKTNRLLKYQKDSVQMLRSRGIRGTAIQIAEDIIGYPIITPSWVRDSYEISYQSASTALQTLEKAGIVQQYRFRNNRIAYIAGEILDVYG